MASFITAGNATNGLQISSDNTGILELKSGTGSGTTAVTIGTGQQVAMTLGSAAAPSITFSGDTDTGIFSPGANTLAFSTNGTEDARFDSSGNLIVGDTSSGGYAISARKVSDNCLMRLTAVTAGGAGIDLVNAGGSEVSYINGSGNNVLTFRTGGSERARIDSSGNWLVATTGTTAVQSNTAGAMTYRPAAQFEVNGNATQAAFFGRTNDGMIVGFYESGTREGDISVSGTTVSYNGGHLSRYAQTQIAKDESLLKGTVLSNLDEMNVYTDADGNPVENEQLNKVKVSDVEGDANVAGVFVNWSYDEQHQVDEINMAMTGDMIIRIAQGVTVQKGDLLMSAGDGTAKPQGDDIVRSKTVAKVTSNHVTCTYEDGSYCVPCVLMAC